MVSENPGEAASARDKEHFNMGPGNMLRQMVQSHGEEFEIHRGGEIFGKAKGLRNHEKATGKPYIGFLPEIEIRAGDKLKGLEAVSKAVV
jgi:hypothetical protein